MDPPFRKSEPTTNIVHLLRRRELNERAARVVPRKLQITWRMMENLGLEKELDGHKGCVNCLEWSERGRILASSSDDNHMVLWDAFRHEKLLTRNTGHHGNVFSIKFMPKTNDNVLITGAADNGVRVHDIMSNEISLICSCHNGRVKRLATVKDVPCVFWSAAEDGLIIQYDLRTKHFCKSTSQDSVLINLNHESGVRLEAKCIATNPTRPELIAVGANDHYVRLYDRRMIKLSSIPTGPVGNGASSPSRLFFDKPVGSCMPLGCAQYFTPGHFKLPKGHADRPFSTTYVTFSPAGNELLVNMGGEQIYLFDIDRNKQCKNYIVPELTDDPERNDEILKQRAYGTEIYEGRVYKDFNAAELPEILKSVKSDANDAFNSGNYPYAIQGFSEAIEVCPNFSVFYANRAACYMRRKWDGDVYAAVRDCRMTILLDPSHVKAYFRLSRALFELGCYAESLKVLDDFQAKFPKYKNNAAFKGLRKDVNKAMEPGTNEDIPSIDPSDFPGLQLSSNEIEWRRNSIDFRERFIGHCNTTTDIKEVNFFGGDGEYVVAGSDDGNLFIWKTHTANIIKILRADEKIVNCVQPHPTNCLLATSGIEQVIRLWSPLPENVEKNDREITHRWKAAADNQARMKADPFDLLVRNMTGQIRVRVPMSTGESTEEEPVTLEDGCRTS